MEKPITRRGPKPGPKKFVFARRLTEEQYRAVDFSWDRIVELAGDSGALAGSVGAPMSAKVQDGAEVVDLKKQLAMWKLRGKELQEQVDKMEADAANRTEGSSDDCPQLQFEVVKLRAKVKEYEQTYLS